MKKFNELVLELDGLGPTSREVPIKATETTIGKIINIMGDLGCATSDGDSILSWTDNWNQRRWTPKPQGNFFEEKILPALQPFIEESRSKEERSLSKWGDVISVRTPMAIISCRSASRLFLESSVALDKILDTKDFNFEHIDTIFSHGIDQHHITKKWVGSQFLLPHEDRELRIGVKLSKNSDDVELDW